MDARGGDALERIDVVGEVIPQMRRLVVSHVLPRHAHAVHVVVHEGGHAVTGGICRGVDVDGATVGEAPQNQFLAPVAKEVGGEAGSGFGAVAGGRSAEGAQGVAPEAETHDGCLALFPLGDLDVVEQFLLGVAIPEDAEIHAGVGVVDGLAVDAP